MPDQSLKAWLDRLESRHPVEIELGLERVSSVARALGVLDTHTHTFTIAGTNGKGSVAAVITAGLISTEYSVGTYTSPHLLRFNERIQIDGEMVDDACIVAAFEAIEVARNRISLTYFETATLAALWIFRQKGVAQQVLEVGLGGRLDAVNIVNADVTVITSIGLDHTDWLGDNREIIAVEKAGVAREGCPCVVAEIDPPTTLVETLSDRGAIAQYIDRDWQILDGRLQSVEGHVTPLPKPSGLLESNIGAALQAIESSGVSPITDKLLTAVSTVALPGRLTHLEVSGVRVVLDVAHNRESVDALVEFLLQNPCEGATRAIFGVMGDKPVRDMISACAGVFTDWSVIDLCRTLRAMPAEQLISEIGPDRVTAKGAFSDVWRETLRRCQPGDRIVVFGSFHTVSEALALLG